MNENGIHMTRQLMKKRKIQKENQIRTSTGDTRLSYRSLPPRTYNLLFTTAAA
jgi:hypothetical protein